jgi:hypothetical protein
VPYEDEGIFDGASYEDEGPLEGAPYALDGTGSETEGVIEIE